MIAEIFADEFMVHSGEGHYPGSRKPSEFSGKLVQRLSRPPLRRSAHRRSGRLRLCESTTAVHTQASSNGSSMAREPTNRRFVSPEMFVFHVTDERISEFWAIWDAYDVATQLGDPIKWWSSLFADAATRAASAVRVPGVVSRPAAPVSAECPAGRAGTARNGYGTHKHGGVSGIGRGIVRQPGARNRWVSGRRRPCTARRSLEESGLGTAQRRYWRRPLPELREVEVTLDLAARRRLLFGWVRGVERVPPLR